MDEQITTITQTNESNVSIEQKGKRGRRLGSSNLHAKHPSSIAMRMKALGVDWVASFAIAIKTNDKQLLTLWLRLLPYLIVTHGHKRVKRWKGRASKAALIALEAMEGK